jgi:DASH complex subunit DAD2
MQMLEEKLATLSDGTEGKRRIGLRCYVARDKADIEALPAVATVLGNWHNVLRAISMASSEYFWSK